MTKRLTCFFISGGGEGDNFSTLKLDPICNDILYFSGLKNKNDQMAYIKFQQGRRGSIFNVKI